MSFEDLGLSAPILTALREQGYQSPSPIQKKAIPLALKGRDILGCAQTGTGKTCAFAAPILQRLSAAPSQGKIRALILTPTRELAIQIDESFAAYGSHLSLRHTVIFGGVGQAPQAEALRRGVDILTATPGRLMDLYQQKLVDLSALEIFVLDEADRMLDMGFIHDVRKILKWLPGKKQTMLFSATMPQEIMELVHSLLHHPVRVAVDPVSSPVEAIKQSVYFVDKPNKTRLLALLVEQLRVKNALVFTRTKHGANKVAQDLGKLGISAAAIHGNKSQSARQQALAEFKAGKLRCLVATDIAARGLDIEELSHVFNYNLPEVPETYVHRIGRTGRAGRAGEAVSFCDFAEKPLLAAIEALIGRSVPVVGEHAYPMQIFEAPKKDKHGRSINEDDMQARLAARESRKQRQAAKKEAAQPLPETEPIVPKETEKKTRSARKRMKESLSPKVKPIVQKQGKIDESQIAESPERKPNRQPLPSPTGTANRKKRETKLFLPEETAAVKTEPMESGQNQREKKTPYRGIRAGVLMETGDAMPCADFYRPNPLDGDVVMDATARLLAPRATRDQGQKRNSTGTEQTVEPEPSRKRRKKKKTETLHSSEKEQAIKEQTDKQQTVKKPIAKKPSAKKSAPKKQLAEEPAGLEPTKERKETHKAPAVVQPAAAEQKKNSANRSRRRDRGPVEPVKSGKPKDSTEQESLMKPYYLDFKR